MDRERQGRALRFPEEAEPGNAASMRRLVHIAPKLPMLLLLLAVVLLLAGCPGDSGGGY